jgi:hypothetical protein
VLWHALQPLLYFWVFVDAYPTLNPMQQFLGAESAVFAYVSL